RPLVDFVTNDWRRQHRTDDLYTSDDDDFLYADKDSCLEPVWDSVVDAVGKVPRRLQRMSLMLLTFLFAMWLGWQYFLWPMYKEQQGLAASVVAPTTEGHYGANMRPVFKDMVQVKTLDSSLLPGATTERKRLVFVGDVHGCKEELSNLLSTLSFKPAHDHLILTGDIIAKGPDSPGVVDLVRSLGASCVRGNHEDRLLLALAASKNPLNPKFNADSPTASGETPKETKEESSTSKPSKHALLAAQLSAQQLDWLAQCPVILRVGPIPSLGEVVVAHAGLVPGVELDRHDPFMAMNMRSVDLETKVPSEGRDGVGWEKLWNSWQKSVSEERRSTVVYGHDSKTGLNLQRWSKGLDSGCVGGGKLSALVV
ncbi:Metallo-dependent phosphatase, partial [Saccharata proteae CBS 121410]